MVAVHSAYGASGLPSRMLGWQARSRIRRRANSMPLGAAKRGVTDAPILLARSAPLRTSPAPSRRSLPFLPDPLPPLPFPSSM